MSIYIVLYIISLQEIYSILDHDCFYIEGYHNISYKSRHDAREGGIAFYISNSIKYRILEKLSIFGGKYFESLFIEVELEDKSKVIIGNIY